MLAATLATTTPGASAGAWRLQEPVHVPVPKGTTFQQDAIGPGCTRECVPFTMLFVRCQRHPGGEPTLGIGARGEPGRGDSHPRRIVVEAQGTRGDWHTLEAFDAEVYDNGAWLWTGILDRAARDTLRIARTLRVKVTGEGEVRTSEHPTGGLARVLGTLEGTCSRGGHGPTEDRWTTRVEAFGGIEQHIAVSPAGQGSEPGTAVEVACQGGTVAWHGRTLSVRAPAPAGEGAVKTVTLEVTDRDGAEVAHWSGERWIYENAETVGLTLTTAMERALRNGHNLHVEVEGRGRTSYALDGSRAALQRAADRCYGATRKWLGLASDQDSK